MQQEAETDVRAAIAAPEPVGRQTETAYQSAFAALKAEGMKLLAERDDKCEV